MVYQGLQGVTKDNKGLQKVTEGYKGLQEVTGSYNGLPWVTVVTICFQGLQLVTSD